MAYPQIVFVNTSVTSAPAPSKYQETGAIVCQGATTLSANATSLLTQASSLTPLLAAPLPIASLSWSSGTVTALTSSAIPGRAAGDTFLTTIASAVPAGYDGTFAATVTGASTFTFALAVNPGAETVPGTYTPPGQVELINQVTVFFAQGTSQAVYVLELGAGDQTTGPGLLSTWIQNNPGFFYAYLVPGGWDATSGLLALAGQYEAPTSKTYFFVKTTTANYTTYTAAMKSIVALVSAPGTPNTEFTHAADFQHALNYAPSSTNRMTPFAFSYLYDVTPWPASGYTTQLTLFKNANINYVGTGAEGGVTNTILFWGTCLDGNQFSTWYSADWIQINADLNIANYVINQSQNALNPLVYDQAGINRLQDVAVSTFTQAITYGLATGTVTRTALDPNTFIENFDNGDYAGQNVVNAVPFATYIQQNPDDYQIGKYGGLQGVYLTQNGFLQIIFNLNVVFAG